MYNPFKQKESPLLGGRKTETLLCQPIPQQEYRWPGRSNNKTPTKIIVCWVTPDVHWLVRCMVLYRDKEKVLNHFQQVMRTVSLATASGIHRFARATTTLGCRSGDGLGVVRGCGSRRSGSCRRGSTSPWLARLGVLLEDGDSVSRGAPCPVALEAVDVPHCFAGIGGIVEVDALFRSGAVSTDDGRFYDPRVATAAGVEGELNVFAVSEGAKLTCHDGCFLCLWYDTIGLFDSAAVLLLVSIYNGTQPMYILKWKLLQLHHSSGPQKDFASSPLSTRLDEEELRRSRLTRRVASLEPSSCILVTP